MKTADIKALELNVDVPGNRAALLEDFLAEYEIVYTPYSELRELGRQLEDVRDNSKETLEGLEEQLADVESKLQYVNDRAAGKELIASRQELTADIELQRTINAGSGNQLVQDITDKAVEFYAARKIALSKSGLLNSEILRTASTLTIVEDSVFIGRVRAAMDNLVRGAKSELVNAEIVKGHERTLFINGANMGLDFNDYPNYEQEDFINAVKLGRSL